MSDTRVVRQPVVTTGVMGRLIGKFILLVRAGENNRVKGCIVSWMVILGDNYE